MAEEKIVDPKSSTEVELQIYDTDVLENPPTQETNPYRTRSFSRYRSMGRHFRNTLS